MLSPINPNMLNTFAPPVMQARLWLADAKFPKDRPLLNLSQAAPVDPPPQALREAMAHAALRDSSAHLYGPVLGLPALRQEIAEQWSQHYNGTVSEDSVAITSGCNQAFCAAIATIAQAGDNVILPVPWYFNHKMWLDMSGVEARILPCGPGMIPDPLAAEALIDSRTKAIILVTPNNPTGAEYPDGVISEFANVVKRHELALIIDETYRDFHSQSGAPHALFSDPDWPDYLVHLYSFSKVFRLTGHRVGALIAGPGRMAQVEKFLDTTTICANQLGQRAALYGLQNLSDWVAGERHEILNRRAHLGQILDTLPGWETLGLGAYFAYLKYPFDMPSDELAQRLLHEQSLLLLPGTMFLPDDSSGTLRIAFANADCAGLDELGRRLLAFQP